MKRIYYILCIAALLGGCQKELLNNPAATHGELTFNTSLDGVPIAQSRAAGVNTDLTANGFYLAGYHTEGKIDAAHATAYPNVFDKEVADQQIAVPQVKYENSKFTLKTIKWLLDDVSYLSFFGWSQSKPFAATVDASTTGILSQTFDSNDKGYPWIDIRNADAPLDQTDVVGSRSINHKNDAVLSAVDLDFRHLLSKLTFKAKSSSGANITFTGVNIKYAASKVRKKGRYTFGSDASAIGSYSLDATEFQAGTAPLGSSYPTITAGAEVSLGSALLLPQALAAGDVSIELKYKLSPNSGNIEGVEQTKTLPLSAFTFEQGNNYTYTINVLSTSILIEPGPTIEPWNVVAMPLPLIPGPRGDVLLLLDGYDKPYIHTDGKKYWLDRSGYNRHVELKAGYQSYDAAKHGYVFSKSAGTGGVIPNIGTVSNLTVDLVAEGTGTATPQKPFNLGPGYLELPYSGIRVDWNYSNYISWNAPSRADINKRTFWTTTKAGGYARIYYNATLRAEGSASGSIALTTNILATEYDGTIFYLKVTAANRATTDLVAESENLAGRFGTVGHKPNPPRADQIMTIGGLKWTKGNLIGVDEMNCQVGAPNDNGLYFRTSSLVGLKGGASGDGKGVSVNSSAFEVYCRPAGYSTVVSAWSTVGYAYNPYVSTINVQNGIGDPCAYYLGSSWRVPTLQDFKSLTVYSPWTSYSGMNGNYGGTVTSGWNTSNSIFFPAAGKRDFDTGVLGQVGTEGAYLSSTFNNNFTNDGLWIRTNSVASMDTWDARRAYPVRCVSNN